MHDAKYRELKVGDKVMVPAIVESLYPSLNYCNVSVKLVATMPPDNSSTTIGTINTSQILRANEGDDLAYTVREDGGARIIA